MEIIRRGADRPVRRPSFPTVGEFSPYTLAPVTAFPVLPGETMKAYGSQIRFQTLPVDFPLAGGYWERWLCYVKLTDIDPDHAKWFVEYDTYSGLPATDVDGSSTWYLGDGGMEWVKEALYCVHKSFFLDEGESRRLHDNLPMVKINNQSWMNNLTLSADVQGTTLTTADQLHAAEEIQAAQAMAGLEMGERSYDRWLESYGVTPQERQSGQPEILRYSREWSLPRNWIEPSDGTPSTAFSSYGPFTLDKAKRFTEPGLVLDLACFRPKLYQNWRGSRIGDMQSYKDWMPAAELYKLGFLAEEVTLGDDRFTDAAELSDVTVYHDKADFWLYGEQQMFGCPDSETPTVGGYNVPMSGGPISTGTEQDLRGLYASTTALDRYFVGNSGGSIYFEGMSRATIMGHVMDMIK